MRNYIILNNQRSDEISGLIIQELAPISKPLQRTQVETIDGRDGDIVTPLGYAAYDKKITIGLYGDFDINEIIAYFATQGTAIFSNEPDKYYNYQILDQIDYERLVRFRVATVTMHVQPFKYSATEGTITVDTSDTVSGEGSDIALDGTAEAPFNVLRHKGNATQKTIAGNNLFNRVTAVENAGLKWADGNTYSETGSLSSGDFISAVAGEKFNLTYLAQVIFYDSSQNYIGALNVQGTGTSTSGGGSFRNFTVPDDANIKFLKLGFRQSYSQGVDLLAVNIMVNKGQTLLPYEPYVGGIPSPNPDYPQDIQVVTGDSMVKITGKNLLDASAESYTYQANSGSTYTPIGDIYMVAGTTYYITFDVETATTSNTRNTPYLRHGNSAIAYGMAGANANMTIGRKTWEYTADYTGVYTFGYWSHTPSNDLTVGNFMIALQNDTTYEPYKEQSYVIPFGDTYLAKVGDYADEPVKVDGTWYIRRAIGKVVLDGTEDGWDITGGGNGYRLATPDIILTPTTELAPIMSDYYTTTTFSLIYYANIDYGIANHGSNHWLAFRNKDITSLANFKTWLGTHNTTVYYALAETTDEEITDQDLIDALDALYDQAHSYKGHTHITATAADGNAPAVLSVEVGEDNESTVTNAGNTTSRPILTIYGQGNIGVYINDVEVLDIALGNEQYITLDSTEMDAYKDSPANLKNRLVTGDYSKLALNAGANKIRFTGNVTKYEISKYSRWL